MCIRDSIRPLLESAKDADVLVFGSPVYYGYPTGQLRSFVERLLFPLDTYMVDENLLTIGMVNEMFIGSRNDEYKWPEIGDQQAMDNF